MNICEEHSMKGIYGKNIYVKRHVTTIENIER